MSLKFVRQIRTWDASKPGYRHWDAEVVIDDQKLAQALGSKATRNKSGHAKLAAGITVTVKERP